MEERIPEKNFDLAEYVRELKAEPLNYRYLEENGKYWSVVDWPDVGLYGEGATLEDCIKDTVEGCKEMAEVILEGLPEAPVKVDCLRIAVKCALSSEEELMRCLAGRIYEDI